jgi:hypothetical protein
MKTLVLMFALAVGLVAMTPMRSSAAPLNAAGAAPAQLLAEAAGGGVMTVSHRYRHRHVRRRHYGHRRYHGHRRYGHRRYHRPYRYYGYRRYHRPYYGHRHYYYRPRPHFGVYFY